MGRDFITIVSGLPRSGTSLMMQMLAAGGIPPLTDDIRAADESNPRGYFEFDAVKRLRVDRSWIEHARGHAVKVIHLLLRELPVGPDSGYRVILMRRSIEEVLASQRIMLERQGRKAGDDAVLAKAFRTQLSQIEQWLATAPAFRVLGVEHQALFENPSPAIKAICDFLGEDLDEGAMKAAIDPRLYQQRRA